ncbi:MAG: hypothetical protein NC302_04480 [Bacteroidales bacterium]|nr:hypothetical protein [Bacteroidales bacterium]MCM1415415.1 hypothetical protein [bacterium]MCM1422939.1 hypothetical protein [bacterium]
MNNFQIQSQMPQPPARRFGPPTQPYLPQPDRGKRNKIIAVCVLAALLLAAGVAGICWFSYTHSPSYRIGKGFARLAKEAEALQNPMWEKLGTDELLRMFFTEGAQADTKMDVTFDTYLGELTLGVDTDYVMDRREREMSAATRLSIMNYEFGHLDVYADRENLSFSVPELFLEDLYLENENVLAQYNASMWAEDWLFGEVHGDDFSIDLFSEPWIFSGEDGAVQAFLDRYDTELEGIRRESKVEAAGQGVYRIRVDGFWFNQLMGEALHDYIDSSMPGRERAMGLWSGFISGPDEIDLLVEMDERGRIESIRLEKELSLCNGVIRLDGDIYFLGGENSLEKIQGRICFDDSSEEEIREREIIWEAVRSLEEGEYCMESEVKYSFLRDRQKETMKLGWDFSYDAPKNDFETQAKVRTQGGDEIALEAEGTFSHVERGTGFDLKMKEASFLLDGEEFLKVRGELDLAPRSRRVKQIAEPKTAFFALDEEAWIDVLDKLYREYGYLLEMASEYLW